MLIIIALLGLTRADFTMVGSDSATSQTQITQPTYTDQIVQQAIREGKHLFVGSDPLKLSKRAGKELWCLGPFEAELFPAQGRLWIVPRVRAEPVYQLKFDCPNCHRW
jgi:hypothetical protein